MYEIFEVGITIAFIAIAAICIVRNIKKKKMAISSQKCPAGKGGAFLM